MLKTAKVVGLNSDTDASLVLAQTEGDLGFFAIVSCSLDDAFSRVRQTLSEAEDVFHSSSQIPSQRLPEVVEFIKKSLADAENLEILVAVTQKEQTGSVLYLLCQGSSLLAHLLRGNSSTDLCGMAEGQLVSGILKPGDRVVMSTKSLVEILGGEIRSFSNFPIENLEDEVAALLPEAETYPVAAVVIEEEAIIPEEPEITEFQVEEERPRLINFIPRVLPHSKKGIGILVGVVLMLGAGMFFLNTKHNKDSEVLVQFEQSFKKASDEFGKAQSLKDTDQSAALASLSSAKLDLADALKIKPQDSKALNLKKQIDENSGGILKIYKVEDLPLWLDLNLVKKGLSGKLLSFSHGNLLILDHLQGVLVELGLDNKSQQTLAGQDKLGEAELASLNGDVAFVYSSDKGVLKVDTKSKQVIVIAKKDEEWGKITQIYGFAGNVYLLDEGKGQIWKYVPVASGYSDKSTYFKEGVKVNLFGTKRLQIDSSVWILKSGGDIDKYTQGTPDFFSLQGLDKPIKDPKSFFVADSTDNFYLLDSGNNRLVILDKKGNYLSQYQSDKFSSFSDFVVDEVGKKAYFLDGSKIYVMELN